MRLQVKPGTAKNGEHFCLSTSVWWSTRKLASTNLWTICTSISYDHLLDISTELGNKICHHYRMETAVCPPELKGGVFTTAAVDNIDHNPTSTSVHDSFHGTGISPFQHPDKNFSGVARVVVTHGDTATKRTTTRLPKNYTSIPPAAPVRQDPPVPKQEGLNKADCQLIPQAMQKEYG